MCQIFPELKDTVTEPARYLRQFIKDSYFGKFPISFMMGIVIMTLNLILLSSCDSGEEREYIDFKNVISDAELHELAQKRNTDVLEFGFDIRGNIKDDARQYIPFLKYLEKATGYQFKLQFAPSDGSIVDDLGTGKVQFAAVGAGSYIKAHFKYGVIPLVRGINLQGKAEYQSAIVVSPDSPIMTIKDLNGKRFAFGSSTSTQGHLIPRIVLQEHGLTLDDLAGYEFTGTHRNCANAVITGHCDAGGMQDTMAKIMERDGSPRILYLSKYYPSSGIAANNNVPSETIKKVKKALIDFQPDGRDDAGMYNWDRTEMPNGFIEAFEEDYTEITNWAKKFKYFSVEVTQ